MTTKKPTGGSKSQLDVDKKFEEFLQESVSSVSASDDNFSARIEELDSARTPKKTENQWWKEMDKRTASNTDVTGKGNKFLKSTKGPQADGIPPITPRKSIGQQQQNHQQKDKQFSGNDLQDTSVSDSSPEVNFFKSKPNVDVPAISLDSTSDSPGKLDNHISTETLPYGRETLEEMADKERFFKKMESDGTVDYRKLNAALGADTMSSTMPALLVNGMKLPAASKEPRSASRLPTDADTEVGDTDDPVRSSMLARVALLDSMDSTLGTNRPGASAESREFAPLDSRDYTGGQLGGLDEVDDYRGVGRRLPDASTMDTLTDQMRGTDTGGTAVKGVTFNLNLDASENTVSRDYDEVYQAMSKVGMATTASSSVHDLTQKSSSSSGVRQGQDTLDMVGASGTLRVPSSDSGVLQASDTHTPSFAMKTLPQPQASAGLHDAVDGYDLSPLDKYSNSNVHDVWAHEVSMGDTKEAQQSKKVLPKSKSPYAKVKSSGYGRRTRSASQKDDTLLASQPSNSERSPATPAAKKARAVNVHSARHNHPVTSSVADSLTDAAVPSPHSYIKSHHALSSENDNILTGWSPADPVKSSINRRSQSTERELILEQEIKHWQEQWQEEKRMNVKLEADIKHRQREASHAIEEQRKAFEHEIHQLKQENFGLNAKIESEIASKKRLMEKAGGNEKLTGTEREISELEKLVKDYQQDNEKVHQELKRRETVYRDTEKKMFEKNEALAKELAYLKEQVASRGVNSVTVAGRLPTESSAVSAGAAVLGAGRIAQLEAELRLAKADAEAQKREIVQLRQENEELRAHIDKCVAQLKQAGDGQQALQSWKVQQEVMEKDMEAMRKKLKWYAENQQMLDKDVVLLKAKNEEIKQLKTTLESLETEAGRKQLELKARAKDRAADAKRISDLERQVKEMEGILKKRHPNSLPVLMWAASAAEGSKDSELTTRYLEDRVKKLEAELAEKDDEMQRSLRALEQKFNVMKAQYDTHVGDLQTQLSLYKRTNNSADHPHTHVVALQREMDSQRERHKKRVTELELETEQLKREIVSLHTKMANAAKGAAGQTEQDKSELELRVKALQQELRNQEHEKQQLRAMVDQMHVKMSQFGAEQAHAAQTILKEAGGRLLQKKGGGMAKANKTFTKRSQSQLEAPLFSDELRPLSADQLINARNYQPDTFTQDEDTDLHAENAQLKHQLENMRLEMVQKNVQWQSLLAESESRERRLREEFDDKLSAVSAHKPNVDRADSQVNSARLSAELHSKLDTQEVLIRHLKDQLSQSQMDAERLTTSRAREVALETKLKQVADELQEAKRFQSPSMRHFDHLQDKVRQLESKLQQRDSDMQALVRKFTAMGSGAASSAEETEMWRRLVDSKNREIERFRSELDTILEVVRELQRQGVVLPSRTGGVLARDYS